jgi:hypothetical protein
MLLILPEFQDPNSDHIEIYEYTDEQGNSMLERINFHSIGLASCKIREKYSDVHDNSTGILSFSRFQQKTEICMREFPVTRGIALPGAAKAS